MDTRTAAPPKAQNAAAPQLAGRQPPTAAPPPAQTLTAGAAPHCPLADPQARRASPGHTASRRRLAPQRAAARSLRLAAARWHLAPARHVADRACGRRGRALRSRRAQRGSPRRASPQPWWARPAAGEGRRTCHARGRPPAARRAGTARIWWWPAQRAQGPRRGGGDTGRRLESSAAVTRCACAQVFFTRAYARAPTCAVRPRAGSAGGATHAEAQQRPTPASWPRPRAGWLARAPLRFPRASAQMPAGR
jgi:hypothetical protein